MIVNEKAKYVQEMSVKCFDIETGKLIVILNELDAKQLGILPLDRVEVLNSKSGKRITALADVTNSMVKENEIGLLKDVNNLLNCLNKQQVKVQAVEKPKSINYIKKKLNNQKLSEQELQEIVKDVNENRISEIELASFMTAVYIYGFDLDETTAMTKALIENGKKINFGKGKVLDKHSVGGINGRATMIVVPIISSQGFMIPKTSSRSITSCSGTADAMEVLTNVNLSFEQIKKITKKVGAVICWGGAVDLAPADDKIIKVEYPLSLDPDGQVVASVLAKKASVGSKYVVIDLPVGPDVKIKSKEKAREMAEKFIKVGKKLGIKVEALITNGTEPSGKAFGPVLEAKHVMEILEGKIFDNLAQKSCELAGALFELVGKTEKGKGTELAKKILKNGQALKKMKEIIKAQGGKIFSSKEIKLSKSKKIIKSTEEGEISRIKVKELGAIARIAGAPHDQKAGVLLLVEEGQKVKKDQPLFEIYGENSRKLFLAETYSKNNLPFEFQQIILEKYS